MTKQAWIIRKQKYGDSGCKNPEQRAKKMSGKIPWNKGKKGGHIIHSDLEDRKKRMTIVGKSNLGRTEEKSYMWKGDKVGYFTLHEWIYKKKGKPTECRFCKTREGKLQWANISWQYKRDVNDYMSLCVTCHRGYDSNNRNAGQRRIKKWQ